MTSLPVVLRPAAGHEGDGSSNNTGGGDSVGGGFVNPSSFLRPRGQSQPMPVQEKESAVDRDQRIGLVSAFVAIPVTVTVDAGNLVYLAWILVYTASSGFVDTANRVMDRIDMG